MARFKLGTSVPGTAVFITILLTWLVREWILIGVGWSERQKVGILDVVHMFTHISNFSTV
jgi:hypothetical protein